MAAQFKATFTSMLACAGWLVVGAAQAQMPVILNIATQSPGFAIPEDFSGLSFETGSELSGKNGVSQYLFSATNTPFITLFQNLGVHNLRLGGGTVDGTNAAIPTLTGIDNVFAFARAVGNLDVIYSLRLLNGNRTTNAALAQYIWQNYQSQIAGFAIGNEPDWNSYHYPPVGTGTDPAITNYSSYLADWKVFAADLLIAAPGAKLMGPDTGAYTNATYYQGKSWTQLFADDEKNSGTIAAVTQHYYVGGSPGTTTSTQAIANMLSPGWITANYAWLYDNNLAPVVADGLAYRLTESNDYLTGIPDASNSHASALWALDYLHWWAAHNCAGVNFHNKSWLETDTIYLASTGRYQVNPKAYALRAFDLGGHGSVEPLAITNPNALNLTAYAVGSATNLFVTIINKEYGTGARNASVTLLLTGVSSGNAAVMFLTAPGGNVAATNGLTLGGASITNNAPWQGQWTALNPVTNGQCTVSVGSASAAVVKIDNLVLTAPAISLLVSRTNLTINFTGTLLSSTNIAGPYLPVAGAISPYTTIITSHQKFYRSGTPQ